MRLQGTKARQGNVVSSAELVKTEFEMLNDRFAQSGPSTVWTGLVDLDEALGEPTNGTVMSVRCASPMLRSAFLMNVAVAVARTGQRTLLVAADDATDRTGLRLLSHLSDVQIGKLRDARHLDERDWIAVVRAAKSDLPLSVLSVTQHSQRFTARRLRRIRDFDVLVLDGCDDRKLVRRAIGVGCRVVWGTPDFATNHDAVGLSIDLSLSVLEGNSTPLKVVEVVVEETRIFPRCKVRLLFDQRRLRFLNGTAAAIEAEDDTES